MLPQFYNAYGRGYVVNAPMSITSVESNSKQCYGYPVSHSCAHFRTHSNTNSRAIYRPQANQVLDQQGMRLVMHSKVGAINDQLPHSLGVTQHFNAGMRGAYRGETCLAASMDDESGDQSFSVEKNLQYLKNLRDTPSEERYQKLDALPTKMRYRLFESGESANILLHHLIQQYDWENFELDGSAVAGIYPYALLARLPYQCYLSDAEWVTLHGGFESLSRAGFTAHALHEAEPQTTDEEECNRVLLFTKNDEVIISIRGTQVSSDWGVNLNFLSSRDDEGRLMGHYHRGYLKIFNKLWGHVAPVLEEIRACSSNKKIKLGIVGYSMGSPLAMMFAMRLKDDAHYEIKKVVTLGGVRGLGSDASEHYEAIGLSDITTRVINYADIVPLGWPNLTHPNSDRLFLTVNGQYWINPDSLTVVANQFQRFSPYETRGYDWNIREKSDHDLVSYVKILSIHADDKSYYIQEDLSKSALDNDEDSLQIEALEDSDEQSLSDTFSDSDMDGLEKGKPKKNGWFNWYPLKKNEHSTQGQSSNQKPGDLE